MGRTCSSVVAYKIGEERCTSVNGTSNIMQIPRYVIMGAIESGYRGV